ncbi:hypothetical protein FACS1894166_08340 [Bacilli bacterium]|nr:hypothetical protein FACS1894166_08340 [Bacilli bacterium]
MQSIFDELNKPKSFEHTPLKIVSNNAEADFIAKQEIAKLNSDSVLYEAVVSGKTPILKQDIAKSCIAKEILELKVGERVICLKNDPDEEYVNGSLGTVINTLPDEVLVHFDNGNKCVIPRAFWEMKDQEGETIATFSQIPLNPAYAITSHKSQGMTLDSVIFDCRNLFTSSQYYVGISRVRDFHHLQTIGAQINQIKASPTAIAFIEEISKKQG